MVHVQYSISPVCVLPGIRSKSLRVLFPIYFYQGYSFFIPNRRHFDKIYLWQRTTLPIEKKKQLSVVVNEINLTMIDVLWLENNSRRVN